MSQHRPIRVSGKRNDIDFWRMHFPVPPLVCLDGEPMDHVCEARSGSQGYVVQELHEDGKPVWAEVVVKGKVIDRIVAKVARHGNVTIEARPERLS